MAQGRWSTPLTSFATTLTLLFAGAASAGIHTWDVNEVFSNADGSIQFVELWEANGGATEINVGNGSITSDTQSFSFGQGQVAGPTTNKYYLLGTAGFAALDGAPTPDAIIPAGSVPFFDTTGDTVSFGTYDSFTFGTVPTNGTDSLEKTGITTNSPTNYAGATGSVNAAPPPSPVPSLSHPALWLVAALLLASVLLIPRRARARA